MRYKGRKGSKFPSKKKCARQGVLDGRNGIPNESWENQKPPFLLELQHEGRLTIERIELNLTQAQDNLDLQMADSRTAEISISKLHELSERTVQSSQSDFEKAMKLELVEDDDLGESRSVKFRTFSTPLYLVLLLLLGLGEFAITRAAFAYIFNEKTSGFVATAMTLATVAISIGYAHMAGVAWKRSHDKVNFPNDSVLNFWKVLGILVVFVVLGLAAARTANTPVIKNGVRKSLNMTEVWLGAPISVFMFFILQFALIMVALGAAYNHYSLPLERIAVMEGRTKKRHKNQIKVLNKLAKIQKEIERLEKRKPRLLIEARNSVRSAIHTYNSLAQTYQASNLRARSKSITPGLASFEPPKLDLPSWYVDLEKNSGDQIL
jgi:hypothetical protein